MNTFNLTISSPDGDIFKDEINMISLRGTEGDLPLWQDISPLLPQLLSVIAN